MLRLKIVVTDTIRGYETVSETILNRGEFDDVASAKQAAGKVLTNAFITMRSRDDYEFCDLFLGPYKWTRTHGRKAFRCGKVVYVTPSKRSSSVTVYVECC